LLTFVTLGVLAGPVQAGPKDSKDSKPRATKPKPPAARPKTPTPPPTPPPTEDRTDRLERADKPPPAPAVPPLAAWSGVWHTGATVTYSSCPGTEPGHQEAFTLVVAADEKTITATEQPEQSLLRKFLGAAELRGKRWTLVLRDKDGKNGMDLVLDEDGRKLVGTRVLVRQAKKHVCSVVYDIESTRDAA
jgi:hypothetical protein